MSSMYEVAQEGEQQQYEWQQEHLERQADLHDAAVARYADAIEAVRELVKHAGFDPGSADAADVSMMVQRKARESLTEKDAWLGTRVRDVYGQTGTVSKVHDECPEGAFWQMSQDSGKVRTWPRKSMWLTFAPDAGGSAATPAGLAEKI